VINKLISYPRALGTASQPLVLSSFLFSPLAPFYNLAFIQKPKPDQISNQIIFIRYPAEESTTSCLSEIDFFYSANLALIWLYYRLGNLSNVIGIPGWWLIIWSMYLFDWFVSKLDWCVQAEARLMRGAIGWRYVGRLKQKGVAFVSLDGWPGLADQ